MKNIIVGIIYGVILGFVILSPIYYLDRDIKNLEEDIHRLEVGGYTHHFKEGSEIYYKVSKEYIEVCKDVLKEFDEAGKGVYQEVCHMKIKNHDGVLTD